MRSGRGPAASAASACRPLRASVTAGRPGGVPSCLPCSLPPPRQREQPGRRAQQVPSPAGAQHNCRPRAASPNSARSAGLPAATRTFIVAAPQQPLHQAQRHLIVCSTRAPGGRRKLRAPDGRRKVRSASAPPRSAPRHAPASRGSKLCLPFHHTTTQNAGGGAHVLQEHGEQSRRPHSCWEPHKDWSVHSCTGGVAPPGLPASTKNWQNSHRQAAQGGRPKGVMLGGMGGLWWEGLPGREVWAPGPQTRPTFD